jgi:type VI secretion system Hcp family effector
MKRFLVAGAAVLAAVVVAVPLWLALDGDDARRTGALVAPSTSGADVGRLTLVGRISGTLTIPVRSFDLDVKSPYDAATGQTSAKATYTPLQVIKHIDGTTPRLMKMLVSNEQITSAKLELLSTDPKTGSEVVSMTYDFTTAAVSGWRDAKMETITLSYLGVTSTAAKGASAPGGAIGRMTYAGTVVPITDFDTGITSPRDVATGQATGKRQHSPVKVVHAIDSFATTALANVKAGGGPAAQVKIELLSPDPSTGEERAYATYTYGGVKTIAVNDSAASGGASTQRLEFIYTSIQVEAEKAVATDNWAGAQS